MKRETKTLIENMDAEIGDMQQQLADMTEARDALAAASEYLRDKCDRQESALEIIAWLLKIAKE